MERTVKATKVKEQIVSSEFIESNNGEQVELKAVSDINLNKGTYSISVKLTTKMIPGDKALREGLYKVVGSNIENVYEETAKIVKEINKDSSQYEMDFEDEGI